MDPLADAYSHIDADKGETIDPATLETAVTETRKFLIKMTAAAILPLVLAITGFI